MKLTRSEAMTLRHSMARVDGWFEAATAQDLADGLAWYDRAYRAAERMADRYGVSVRCAAGVIAALSPRAQWGSNVAGAEKMIASAVAGEGQPSVNGLPDNRAKAWRIATGEDPDEVLSGPKVCAFFANILGDTEAVTIDMWAARAAEGWANERAPARRRYALLSESYRRVARKRGLCPRDVQAAVWTVYRRLNARAVYDPIGV